MKGLEIGGSGRSSIENVDGRVLDSWLTSLGCRFGDGGWMALNVTSRGCRAYVMRGITHAEHIF